MDNKQLAREILTAIGEKENIVSVTHCMTRLRFQLKDDSIANDEKVKEIEGILGVVHSGGQYQVIVGQKVPKVYKELNELAGFTQEVVVDENPENNQKKEKLTLKSVGSKIMSYLAGSMTPLIPAIIAGALFKTIIVVCGPSMLGLLAEESDFYVLCNFIYNAAFYFLPIYLGYTAAKKLNLDPILGMFLGGILVVPDFVALVDTQSSISVYGLFPAPVAKYGQTVLPILLSVWVMSYVNKLFKKIIPDILSTVFVPFLTMFVMVPVMLCLCAPVGTWCGTVLSTGLIWFGEHGGFFAVAVVAALWQFLVMTGMHNVIGLFSITVLLEQGSEFFIRPAGVFAMWAVFGMALGAFLRIKDTKEKGLALGYLVSGILGGVTEPTLYGIGFKYKKPFAAMAIGGFVGGLYGGLTHVGCFSFSAPGFLSVIAYVNGGTANLVNGIVACAISFVVSAVVTFFIGGFDGSKKPKNITK